MPSKLSFIQDNNFICNLKCGQCDHLKPDGQRCKNRVCIGAPTCWIHSKQEYAVRVKPSTIAGTGKGLFAETDFDEDDWICPYGGSVITPNCFDQRYPGNITTAPYAVALDNGRRPRTYDAACDRGIGSMANGLFNRQGMARPVGLHNARMINHPTKRTLWLQATKDINANEEIFSYYGAAYKIVDDHTTKRSARTENVPCR